MYIKCWGSRGSIPVSGKEYLKYGGDTTCLEIRTKSNDIIIIDAGTGIRRLGNHLTDENENKYHFLFTHAHWDHVMGFPYFKPLYSKDAKFKMHRCPFHDEFVESIISKVMAPPNFPVKYSDVRAELSYEEASPVEFEIGSFVFLTDNELGFIHPGGLPYNEYAKFSLGADLLIHDAEYTPEEYKTYIDWGHSVYTDVLNLAFEAGVKKLGLFHLNQERTDREMNKIVKACGKIIAEKGSSMECFAVGSNMTFEL